VNLEHYAAGQRDRYADFATAVAQILSAAIRKNSQLHLQQIQDRAKHPDSLKTKLAKAGLLESDAIEDEIKDLAGCRLIFYTNSDISKFLSSEILRSNFKIDRIRTKFHYPVPLASDDPSLFISNNFVVELNEVRAALPEYERFSGLRCEVQVQTISQST
jgi:ppGpp synthetase/RelA/SpoT-type nucleotidyltranferase